MLLSLSVLGEFNAKHTGANAVSVQPALFAGDCAATGYNGDTLHLL